MKGTQNQHVSISEDLPDFSLLHRMFSIEHGRSPYSDFGVSKGGVLNYTIRHTKKRKIDTDSGMLLPTRCRDDSTGNNNIPQKAPGLLKSSYLPDDDSEALRIIVRYRKTLTQDCNHFILRMPQLVKQSEEYRWLYA